MAKNKKVTAVEVLKNPTIEAKYDHVGSAFSNIADLEIQKIYNLQAQAEAASEDGDSKAERYFTSLIEEMIHQNPELEASMNLLEDALTYR